MPNALLKFPQPVNEPVLNYAPGSIERTMITKALDQISGEVIDIPMYIGKETLFEGKQKNVVAPHEHAKVLARFFEGDKHHVEKAIQEALKAKKSWEETDWSVRASIFLKAADLIASPYRYLINAATMLGQSKNVYQAEIDAACELIDFLRFNVFFMQEIYQNQPISSPGIHNSIEYRPLEGFVFALTPFNFTAIAGNLPASAALMGNVVVWKPAYTQLLSAYYFMQVLEEAGLPKGVINLITVDGPEAGEVIFKHPDFAGIHFTGSTKTFKTIWKTIGQNIDLYKNFPRIVGETGGKDFVLVHESARVPVVATALIRGAFEYQGQKCSAASRAYIPKSMWQPLLATLRSEISTIKIGPTTDLSNFVNAVIDETAFNKIAAYIETVRNSASAEILVGGKYDKSKGYFIEPTILLTTDPHFITMEEEIFGPVLTVYLYEESFEEILDLIDKTSPYALTGAIIATDKEIIELARKKLRYAAGNFYINDKPTGAVVGQQPFGGARHSGTNDKAGSSLNLLRWVSAQTTKENYVPPVDYRYPFLT